MLFGEDNVKRKGLYFLVKSLFIPFAAVVLNLQDENRHRPAKLSYRQL